jgi:hypothetical protein
MSNVLEKWDGFLFRQSSSKFFDKVLDVGSHDQRTSTKKTLTKFLIENFDRIKGL